MYIGSCLRGSVNGTREVMARWIGLVTQLMHRKLFSTEDIIMYQGGDGAVVRTGDGDAARVEHHTRQLKLGVRVLLCLEHLGKLLFS